MTSPLLETKLYIPRSRRGLVPRPRLSERLNRGGEAKLTLVSAPAASGNGVGGVARSRVLLPADVHASVGVIPGFVVGLTLGAILLTWLYNSTGGSVLAVVAWHA
jgi:hypothetical protein